MKTKTLFIVIFALLIIVVLYITTKYAEELQKISTQSSNSYVSNVAPTPKLVTPPITYSLFKGTYNGTPSFDINYIQGWTMTSASETPNSESATFKSVTNSETITVYSKCQSMTPYTGKVSSSGASSGGSITKETEGLYTGYLVSSKNILSFYNPGFSLVLNYSSTQKIQVLDSLLKSLVLYNQFQNCK